MNFFKKKPATSKLANVEVINKNQMNSTVGGSGGTTATPDPVDAARVKSHSNQNNN
jgi:hypothetical protein